MLIRFLGWSLLLIFFYSVIFIYCVFFLFGLEVSYVQSERDEVFEGTVALGVFVLSKMVEYFMDLVVELLLKEAEDIVILLDYCFSGFFFF